MNTFLKTKTDEISFLTMLFRAMDADGKTERREIAYIRALAENQGISDEVFKEAETDYRENGPQKLEFSSNYAMFASIVSAIELSVVDMDFADSERNEMIKMVEDELGFKKLENEDKEKVMLLDKYIDSYMAAEKKFSEASDRIADKRPDISLDNVYPEISDKKSYIKSLLRITYADNKSMSEETELIYMLGRVFKIDDALIKEAFTEFKENPGEALSFTNTYSSLMMLRESTRLACIDNKLDAFEKEELLKMAREVGADLNKEIMKEIEEAIALKLEAKQNKENLFKKIGEELKN